MVPLLFLLLLFTNQVSAQAPLDGFRPPTVPILVMDPFINTWSLSDKLYNVWVTDWNDLQKQCDGMIRVDGDVYLFMGPKTSSDFVSDTTIQNSVKVWPTRTVHEMSDPKGRVKLTVQFTTPLLPKEWDISSRPVTYVTFTVISADAKNHSVQLFFDLEGHIVVNKDMNVEVQWNHFQLSNEADTIDVMQIGTVSQKYFDISAYDDGIDWGYAYVAVPKDSTVSTVIGEASPIRSQFKSKGTIPTTDDTDNPKVLYKNWDSPTVAWNFTLEVGLTVSKHLAVAYDDIYSIQYFGKQFHPYWRRPEANATIETVLQEAFDDYDDLMQACEQFDTELVRDLEVAGGEKYATLAALAYRQTMAATKLVWNDELQRPWAFLRSISTATDMSPLDTIAAASSLILYTDPAYLELLLLPILAYANNETDNSDYDYPYPWAPHHLGVYPNANAVPSQQVNMPMEDTGDLFILLLAITKNLGDRFIDSWYPKYWPLLQSWADYLVTTLPDPGDQVSTDTFLPSTPHDANLALKGIIGLGAFAQLCFFVGKGQERKYYNDLAESFAQQWMDLAREEDHYKLAYDQNNTWSLKYNLFYDRLLALGLFPEEVVTQEIEYYIKYHLNIYGIPLDNRVTYTKLDWMSYVAALSDSTIQKEIFENLYNWANSTTPFTPLTDWYDVTTAKQQGYTARPVVGALYSLMLI